MKINKNRRGVAEMPCHVYDVGDLLSDYCWNDIPTPIQVVIMDNLRQIKIMSDYADNTIRSLEGEAFTMTRPRRKSLFGANVDWLTIAYRGVFRGR